MAMRGAACVSLVLAVGVAAEAASRDRLVRRDEPLTYWGEPRQPPWILGMDNGGAVAADVQPHGEATIAEPAVARGIEEEADAPESLASDPGDTDDVFAVHSPATQSCDVPEGMRVEDVEGLFKLVVYPSFNLAKEKAKHREWWEQVNLAALSGRLVPETGAFLDVGASSGYHSFLFASRGYRVIAVEPLPKNVLALKASLCLNPGLKGLVTVVPKALVATGHSSMRCTLRTLEKVSTPGKILAAAPMRRVADGDAVLTCGNGDQLRPCESGEEPALCSMPAVSTLDRVLEDLAPATVDLASVDVGRGFECEVFGGGQLLFDRFRPRLLRVGKRTLRSLQCVVDEATKHGFSVQDLNDTAVMAST